MPTFPVQTSAILRGGGILLVLLCIPQFLHAHVKWFSHFNYADEPVDFLDAITPVFLGLMLLSIAVVAIVAALENRISELQLYKRLEQLLANITVPSDIVIRIGLGAVLLLSWQDDAVLVPELNHAETWLGWYQFGLALLLLTRRTTPFAGLGLIALYVFCAIDFGVLHMLDYPIYLGVGYFLLAPILPEGGLRKAALPVLLTTLGFSLCWVALEKIVYPQWGLYVLYNQPQLTMGLNTDFFLEASAFIEFTLGFVVIVGLMKRPVALMITGVFFMTTLTFGKVEVIGHTLIHSVLIVMLIDGRGKSIGASKPFLKKPLARAGFMLAVYPILLFGLLLPYEGFAEAEYLAHHNTHNPDNKHIETKHEESQPELAVDIEKDSHSGFNIKLHTNNFQFDADAVGQEHVHGAGHAHLYINDVKHSRIYHDWHHIDLRPGRYEIVVTLNANDHRVYAVEGRPVMHVQTLEVSTDDAEMLMDAHGGMQH